MHGFEKFLIEKGYIQHRANRFLNKNYNKNNNKYFTKYEAAPKHLLSSLGDMAYTYIHKSDVALLKKIKEGHGFTFNEKSEEEFKNTILFGLNEHNMPPTLLRPRPKIRVIRERSFGNGKKMNVLETEFFDNSMNVVLLQEDYETIFKAMYDHSIVFEYNYLNKENKHDS